MDDAVEKDAIRCTQSIQIAELLEEIVQLKMDVEILRSDFLTEKKIILAGRDSLELVIDDFNRKEMKRNEDDKVASALVKSIKDSNEPVRNIPSETFGEFLKKNEFEKVLEEQKIQKRNNEYLLEQQRLVLGEIIRLLSSAAVEVDKRKKEREREKVSEKEKEDEKQREKQRVSEVDINITESVTEQLRCVYTPYSSFFFLFGIVITSNRIV